MLKFISKLFRRVVIPATYTDAQYDKVIDKYGHEPELTEAIFIAQVYFLEWEVVCAYGHERECGYGPEEAAHRALIEWDL